MDILPEAMLREGSALFGAGLEEGRLEKLLAFKELLKEWNLKMNLTAIEEDRDIIIKHFIDSLSILPYIPGTDSRLIDVGTGAGFPGIPLKIAYDSLGVVLLDSLEKRVKFLNEMIKVLDMKRISALHGRAEEFGHMEEHREKYDIAVARAVAGLPVLLEYCLPFVRTGGLFIAMKGSSLEEVDESGKALEILGGKIEKIDEIMLPYTDMKRNIIVIRKFRQTPTKYPRKPGKPAKEPLI